MNAKTKEKKTIMNALLGGEADILQSKNCSGTRHSHERWLRKVVTGRHHKEIIRDVVIHRKVRAWQEISASGTYYQHLVCTCSLHILHSFSAPHSPHDNAVMESFFSTLKREELYRKDYRSEREFLEALSKYVSFYNNERPIKMFQYRTPAKREFEYFSKNRPSE